MLRPLAGPKTKQKLCTAAEYETAQALYQSVRAGTAHSASDYMHWFSEACVLLRLSDLLDENYTTYRAAAGHFSLSRPYQASASTTADLSPAPEELTEASQAAVPIAGQKRAAKEQVQSRLGKTSPEAPGQHSDHSRKRRKPSSSDPQSKSRQLQAQQRHNVWQPSLLAACHLLQQYLQKDDSNVTTLQSRPASCVLSSTSDSTTKSASSTEQLQTFDLISLHELKYTLRPKVTFLPSHCSQAASNLFDSLICNEDNIERLADAFGYTVLIPAQASFLLSDVKRLNPLMPGVYRIALDV